MAVSDWSFKVKIGPFAFVMEGQNEKRCLVAVNMAPGYLEDQKLLWSKLAGMYGIIVATNELCKEHHITNRKREVGCNNVEALQRAFDLDYCVCPNHMHFDLTTAIYCQVQNSPIKWQVRHVQGHQANNSSHALDQWAKLNVESDQWAKDVSKQFGRNSEIESNNIYMGKDGRFGS